MKITKISTFLALSVLIPQIAYAAPVQSIFASRAEGKNGQPLATITLWPGYGTNLNLIPTGEVIKKAWLDDPSRVAIDFDGCLARSGEGQGAAAGDNCGTTVIHLRQITGVTFPGLTSSENATTLLTLIAEGSEGKKLYQFRVEMGKGAPQYNTLSVYPDSQGTPYIDVGLRKATVEDITKGLSLAEAQKLISRRDAAWSKVQNFLAQVRSGESVGSSLQRSGANMAIITKLAELSFAQQQPPIPPREDPTKSEPVSQAPADPQTQTPPSPKATTPPPQPTPAIPPKPQALALEPNKKMSVDVGYWLLDRGLADPEAWSRGSDSTDYRILFDVLRRGKESGTPFAEALVPAQKLSGVNDDELVALTRNLMTRSVSVPPGKNTPAPVAAEALKSSPTVPNPKTAEPAVDKGSLPSPSDEKSSTEESSVALAQMGVSSPAAVLARFEIPLKEGGAIRADKLLAVQQRIWLWKRGTYRKKLGSFISALVRSKETDPDRSLEQAIQQSGLSLNDVRSLAKASQAGTEEPVGNVMQLKENEQSSVSPRSEEPQSPTASPAANAPSGTGSTRAILSRYQLPTQEGDYFTADKLLDIQQSIWLVKRGIYRQKLGAFIATLVTSQEKDPQLSLEAAVRKSGLSLNDVQFLVKTAQMTTEGKTEVKEGKAETSPAPTKLSNNDYVDNAATVSSEAEQVAKLPTGGTIDTLFKLRIPLERGGSVGAEQLLTVQEKIWNLEGGTVRKKLARFIAALTASASQGNDQALAAAVRESGFSLNKVQSLLEFSNGPKSASSVGQLTATER